MSSVIQIVLADDHELILEGLRSLLEAEEDMHVIATCTGGERALEIVRQKTADVLVLDMEMRDMSGIACLQQIRAEQIPVRVLVLTAYSDGSSMRAALESGADGYVLKTEPPQHTLTAIRQIANGQFVFPIAAKRWLLGSTAAPDPLQLTAREEEVLSLVAEGHTNAEIARRLRVSDNTVKFHLQNLYLKLGVSNRTEAAARFLQQGRAPGT